MKLTQRLWIVGILIFLAALSVSCRAAPQRESKPSEDWSRGVAVGHYARGSIGIAVEGAGERVHLAWPSDIGEGTYIRYVQLDAQANPVITKDLKFPGLLRAPRLVLAETGELHLFWASRPPGGKAWTVWHVKLDGEGNPVTPTLQISLEGDGVGNYAAVPDYQGGALVTWDRGLMGEIYLQHLDAGGVPAGEPVILTSKGESPSLWVNPDGNLALTWQGENGFEYARSALSALSTLDPTEVVDIALGTGQSVVGPFLGLAGEWAYIFWAVLNQSGLEAGTGYTAYTVFPADAPAKSSAERILMSSLEEQSYSAYQGSFALTQLVPPINEAWATSDFILSPSVMLGHPSDELAVAIALNQQMRLDTHLQIAVVIFKDGQFVGYTLGTKTEGISDDPVVFVDSSSSLHLAWREGAAGNSIFYATTQPEAIAALDRLNAGDVVNAILQGGVESLVSIALLPVIGFGWLLPGMLIVVIVKLVRDRDMLTEWRPWIPLSIAILSFYIVKFATLPTITTYVPFSAWLDVPAWLGAPLRIGVPVFIFVVSALVANLVRRRYSQSAAVFYFVFALLDAVLSLAIYGVNFLGVY